MTEVAPFSDDGGYKSHLRLTPEAVRQNWLSRFYTPAGYLYHLLLALRKEGWWYRIENVSKFCRQWKINRRTFYRAKAELLVNGKLEENIVGGVGLRIPTLSQIDSPVSNLSPPVTNLSPPVTDLSHSTAKTQSEQGVCGTTDLSQLSFNSSLKTKREKAEFSTGSPQSDNQVESPPNHSGVANQDQDRVQSQSQPTDWINFSAQDDPDFFAFVVKYKIPKLPEQPASKQSAALGWIRKYGDRLYSEYGQWLETERRITSAKDQAAASQPRSGSLTPPKEISPEQRLKRYQMLWQTPTCRRGVTAAIKTNPQWGLEIGPNGPRKVIPGGLEV
ncbi:MAG: hypothetical protein QNJ46_15985 [Leptolyngbyaceae cyanobacterium MO_188.B28]|nr:hypothetical protein [Leptolyngbyaceae cyanobacterium MO_188.B28]